MKFTNFALTGLVAALLAITFVAFGREVSTHGNLQVPADYRTMYQLLGSWAVQGEPGQGACWQSPLG